MPIPSDEDQVRNSTILGPSYQSLMARYGSNFTTQWQIVALGLTAQGFVVAAASGVSHRIYTAILLSIVILFTGAATIISSLRVGLFAAMDRLILDEYEKVFLVGDFERFRLLHSVSYKQRESLAHSGPPPMGRTRVQRFIMLRIVRPVGPTMWWAILELVISIAGAAIPILGIFGL
jgi:hypothetical protein